MSVAILGGGISGLACGYKLSKRGIKIRIFESEPYLGGLASWYKYCGLNIPKTYHHVLRSDAALIDMIEELKLSIRWKKVKTGFYSKGKIFPFNTALDLMRFKHLPLTDRLKFGLLLLSTRWSSSLQYLEKISIESWIRILVGLCLSFGRSLGQNYRLRLFPFLS